MCTRSHVFLLSWGSAAGRGGPAGSAPAWGCRPGLSAGAQTTARHLFDQTAQEKKTVRYVDKTVKEIRNVHTGLRSCWREKTATQNIWLSSVHNKQAGVFDYLLRQSADEQYPRKTGALFVLETRRARISFELACAPAASLPVFPRWRRFRWPAPLCEGPERDPTTGWWSLCV